MYVPCECDLYFTLKYVAGYGGRSPDGRQTPRYDIWTAEKAEVEAQNAIDSLLCSPLPEEQLWHERQQLEAKLFGCDKPYKFLL